VAEQSKTDPLKEAALRYHREPTPGKLAISATKPLATQRDLSLAYSPGVAAACEAIVDDPLEARALTARGNLVAVITNGTAVLGLGDIGPLAGKPVMEGKAVLFKKFAGIDVFDLEVDAHDPERLIEVVAALEPTFGAINLEDIKAPECFQVEAALRARMKIPVFHDDQHGTAIIVAAAFTNALRVTGKDIADVKLVACGAGAAGMACLDLLVSLGLAVENVTVTDKYGVLYAGRVEDMDERRAHYAKETDARTLDDVIGGADAFFGVSAAGVLTGDMVARMAEDPIILALANPTPEIMPDDALAAKPGAILATGRSDYPNQVNNVLCFPFIFRGALDVGATTINAEMEIACVEALAKLARTEVPEIVTQAYGGAELKFGPNYLIPKPFDPRLISTLAPAVAKAAMDSGVATRPIDDLAAYARTLEQFVFKSGFVMKPVFDAARAAPKRVAYAEGEQERVLRAAQVALDEGLAKPILIGRRRVVETRIKRFGLRMAVGVDVELVDPENDSRFKQYWAAYHALMGRSGVTPEEAKRMVRTNATVIAALMVHLGDADAMLCGVDGRYGRHLGHVLDVIGLAPGITSAAALSGLVLAQGTYFICDTQVTENPSAVEVAEMTLTAADHVRRFGIEPIVALLSHSNFGSHNSPESRKMRAALAEIRARAPGLKVEGEMKADSALSQDIRDLLLADSAISGPANLLVMPSLDAANIAFNFGKMIGDGIALGPMLLGMARPAHVLTPSVTARGILNMTALAVVDAQRAAAEPPEGLDGPASKGRHGGPID
jgi:malate dehydrogenase (oxaloacetate-decarboxylating)(NADP+)